MVGGDENAAKDVGLVVAALDSLPARTRLVVHHTGRTGPGSRGSSVLDGAADVMAAVERDGPRSPLVTLSCAKPPKTAEPWDDRALIFAPWGTSGVLEEATLAATMSADDVRRDAILEAVRDAGRPLSQTAVRDAVGGKRERVRALLDDLVRDGSLSVTPGPRNADLYSLPVTAPLDGGAVGRGAPQTTLDAPHPAGGGPPL